MPGLKCFWCKIITLCIFGIVGAFLVVLSIKYNYQELLAWEHIRFRHSSLSQINWIISPYGKLNSYIFNITNAEAFLSGEDTKLKVNEVGPIVYKITGRNEVLHQNETTLTYRRFRYDQLEFDAEASCAPDILNQTVVLPNYILLGAAAKLHDWVFLVRHAFNAVTRHESVFINQTIYYFLWDFRTPALDMLSNYVPNIATNCGMLYNALRPKEEVYSVKIGMQEGFANFFRVNSLNNITYFPEQEAHLQYMYRNPHVYCPINVSNTFDNSLFPPFLTRDKELAIVASELCRTHRLRYKEDVTHLGFDAYKYVISDFNESPQCLDESMGIKLPKGMFDITSCISSDVPSAFSAPHFYRSSYNWSQHFEGFAPNAEKHEATIYIQPLTGIPIEEKYRFQSNIPMPDMLGYNKHLQRFSHMMIPTFWYEYDLDDLPTIVLCLMRFNIYIAPILQPILMALLLCGTICCYINVYLSLRNIRWKTS